jgi:hypothetical protein
MALNRSRLSGTIITGRVLSFFQARFNGRVDRVVNGFKFLGTVDQALAG